MTPSTPKRCQLAIVDYGLGNQTSLQSSCRQLGHRVVISNDPDVLDQANVLLLPGVGAFPTAMANLHELNLVDYLHQASQQQRGIIGICLGMQLLTERSCELELTSGLGLIPGETIALTQSQWHIGWNNLEIQTEHPLLMPCDGDVMYFNHSFCYSGPNEMIASISRLQPGGDPIVAAIHRDHLIGLQFHPEKSQQPGLKLLDLAIRSLC